MTSRRYPSNVTRKTTNTIQMESYRLGCVTRSPVVSAHTETKFKKIVKDVDQLTSSGFCWWPKCEGTNSWFWTEYNSCVKGLYTHMIFLWILWLVILNFVFALLGHFLYCCFWKTKLETKKKLKVTLKLCWFLFYPLNCLIWNRFSACDFL